MQLLLWAQEEEQREIAIGDVFEATFTWANEDSSPADLQHLATLMRGKLEVSDWRIKPAFWYRVLDTRIEGEKVLATCRIVPSPLGSKNLTIDELEEESEY